MQRETVRPTQFLYWFQVLYGVAAGALGLTVYQRWRGGDLGAVGALSAVGLALFTLFFIMYLQNLHKKATVIKADYSRTCYNCRLPVNRYSEFCEHCGADQIERAKMRGCPECDADLYQGTAFCPVCGSDLRNKRLKKIDY